MNKQTAIKLLDDTFNSDFNTNKYIKFIKELFNKFTVNQKSWKIWKEYEEYIESYQLLGSYSQNKDVIDVLVVKLKKESSRDRARTMQRNFIAKYLGNANKNGALVAFYGDDTQDWRFSFVKMEYNLVKDELGKVKPVQELTPAKRYSFLVGVNEPNHTCASQFLKLVMDEEIDPSLLEIENAFSIDNVTIEFFNEYKELFLELEESLRDVISKDKHVEEEFKNKEISSVDFAKKLLGQIVFIYFLQKKGWLGVVKDEQGNFKKWGTGSKKFMRTLFDKKIIPYDNFFNDVLEPLFYEALATERDNSYYSRFKCKIPFLNGGLFEPLNNYDWAGTEIVLDNGVFDRILKTFDRFNFTVKEDEPLEKEVAVDPEMLGKVFENLLTVKDRKSKGAFYTPREIVHYMCQQSLINYLETNTVIDRKDIEKFIQLGDLSISNDQRVILDIQLKQDKLSKGQITGKQFETEISNLLKSLNLPKSIVSKKEEIDILLKDIKVVDPAVGSGAFPLGMLNEILQARSILTLFFDKEKQTKRNDYDLKREIIENCLYGVDIESSAVDITKLRFWLSLIVDEMDMKNIKPLPNLDHKIMCGNSLLEEFEGVKLFNEKLLGEVKKDNSKEINQINDKIKELSQEYGLLANGQKSKFTSLPQIKRKITSYKNKIKELNKKEFNQITLVQNKSEQKINSLKILQKQFFNEQRKGVKKELREKIDQIEWDLIEETLKEQGNENAMQKLNEYKKNKSKPFFLWKLYFSEVFQKENPGFDVVIANPPYIGERGHKEIFREIKFTTFGKAFYKRKMDYFYFFFHKALDISRAKSSIAFITTNYYITADGAINLRSDFKNRTTIKRLINFNELKIFDSAKGQHNMITILSKEVNNQKKSNNCITHKKGNANSHILTKILNWKDESTDYYNMDVNEIYDGDPNYIRLAGCNSSNKQNEFGSILMKLKEKSVSLEEIKNINQGVLTGIDKVSNKHILKFGLDEYKKGSGIFVLSDKEVTKLNLNTKERKIIKSYYKNSDIFKYYTNSSEHKRNLIYATRDLNISEFPQLKNHFYEYEDLIRARSKGRGEMQAALKLGKWWVIFAARQGVNFEGPKIVCPQRSYTNTFGYNEEEWYGSADVYFITNNETKNINLKYVLALLNSKLYYVWLYFRGKRKGDMLELFYQPLTEIPIKEISPNHQRPFIELIDQILSITKEEEYSAHQIKQSKVKNIGKQIDQLIYELYALTPEEIKIVEEFNKK